MRTRPEGTPPHDSTEPIDDQLTRLKRLYDQLGVPPADAHEYVFGAAPQGA